jgi:hypothetical protein
MQPLPRGDAEASNEQTVINAAGDFLKSCGEF